MSLGVSGERLYRVDTPQQNTCSTRCPPILPIDKPDTVTSSALPQIADLVVEFSLTPPPQERILVGNEQLVIETVDNIILSLRIVQVDNINLSTRHAIGKVMENGLGIDEIFPLESLKYYFLMHNKRKTSSIHNYGGLKMFIRI